MKLLLATTLIVLIIAIQKEDNINTETFTYEDWKSVIKLFLHKFKYFKILV